MGRRSGRHDNTNITNKVEREDTDLGNRKTSRVLTGLAAACAVPLSTPSPSLAESERPTALEEVLITAKRPERSLQDAPIAISVLDDVQLETLDITSLAGLEGGAIPSLRVQPFGNAPSTLIISIRGNGPTDVGQVTREGSVGVYMDGFFLSRAQGLALELADVERVEVLRGPQGTLFGRNATGGAVNVVTKRPTGELGFKQSLRYGRFDEFRSVTRINLPEAAGVRVKFDYVHHQRDGWVDNTAPGEADYNAFNKDAARVSMDWRPSDDLEFQYRFDFAETSAAQLYFQLFEDNIGIIGVEDGRQRETRFPVAPLEPSVTEHRMHALTASWSISDTMTLRSLTSYRELDEETRNNYAGALYFNGLIFAEDVDQEQWTQELQLLGTTGRFEWLAGFYYYEEDVRAVTENLFSLNLNIPTGGPVVPIIPPTDFGGIIPVRTVDADARSVAVYGHATWTPPVLDDRLRIDLGLRYTDDSRSGSRADAVTVPFDLDTDQVDPSVTVVFDWTDTISTYVKWSNGYKAGGVSPRSASFQPYFEEEAETFEIGLKSEFWDRRARLNLALFATDYQGLQIDFADPDDVQTIETINATNKVQVDGLELDLTVVPVPGLVVGLSYTYLDGDIPPQPNPLAGGAVQQFLLAQTPSHAGFFSLDYTFAPFRFGTLTAHVDVSATDEYAYLPVGFQLFDAYTLVNARLTLADIPLGGNAGALSLSVWGRNLTDEEYVVFGFPVLDPPIAVTQAFGTPRTVGFDVTYAF